MPNTSPDAASVETTHHLQEQLKVLHEVSNELTKARTVDELCRCAIELGLKRLGFDRLGIWFLQDDARVMVGTFGTDESGQIRDERAHSNEVVHNTLITKAITEHTPLVFEEMMPLFNESQEPVGTGWTAVALLWDGDSYIGWISADNLINHHPANPDDLEILRLYGLTIGHLVTRRRAEEALLQERVEAALQKEKVKILTEFINTLSHDLKTPLAVIKTSLYLVERLNDPAREKAKLEVIKEQTLRLEKLIEDVLIMSRLEQSADYSFQMIDVNALIQAAQQTLQPQMERKHQSLNLDLAPELPRTRAISVELQRAIVNLIENAVHNTPEAGSISVYSRLENDALVLQVSDTSSGITPEDLPHIFDRFYRADVSQTADRGGTGLGLAIVKKIAELHGGTVQAESNPGEGSRFRVMLPVLSKSPPPAN